MADRLSGDKAGPMLAAPTITRSVFVQSSNVGCCAIDGVARVALDRIKPPSKYAESTL